MVINHCNKLPREVAESHLRMFSEQMYLFSQAGCFQQTHGIGLDTGGTSTT